MFPLYDCSDTFRTDLTQELILWLKERYIENENGRVHLDNLYARYKTEFCGPKLREPQRKCEFGKAVKRLFPEVKNRRLGPLGRQTAYYVGIASIDASPGEEDESRLMRHVLPLPLESRNVDTRTKNRKKRPRGHTKRKHGNRERKRKRSDLEKRREKRKEEYILVEEEEDAEVQQILDGMLREVNSPPEEGKGKVTPLQQRPVPYDASCAKTAGHVEKSPMQLEETELVEEAVLALHTYKQYPTISIADQGSERASGFRGIGGSQGQEDEEEDEDKAWGGFFLMATSPNHLVGVQTGHAGNSLLGQLMY